MAFDLRTDATRCIGTWLLHTYRLLAASGKKLYGMIGVHHTEDKKNFGTKTHLYHVTALNSCQ